MASSTFPSTVTGVTVDTATSGALSGDGSAGNKLAVGVDGATIDVNGSNQLAVIGGASSGGAITSLTSITVVDGIVTAIAGT